MKRFRVQLFIQDSDGAVRLGVEQDDRFVELGPGVSVGVSYQDDPDATTYVIDVFVSLWGQTREAALQVDALGATFAVVLPPDPELFQLAWSEGTLRMDLWTLSQWYGVELDPASAQAQGSAEAILEIVDSQPSTGQNAGGSPGNGEFPLGLVIGRGRPPWMPGPEEAVLELSSLWIERGNPLPKAMRKHLHDWSGRGHVRSKEIVEMSDELQLQPGRGR